MPSRSSPRGRTSTTTTRPSSTRSAGWLTREELRLHAIHAPVTERFERALGQSPVQRVAGRRRPGARGRARRGRPGAGAAGAGRRAGRPPGPAGLAPVRRRSENSREAARRSLEDDRRAGRPLGVRVALEVIPNALLDARGARGDGRGRTRPPRASASASTSGTRTCMGDVVDAIETLSGLLIATHVHDNHGRRDEHLRAV